MKKTFILLTLFFTSLISLSQNESAYQQLQPLTGGLIFPIGNEKDWTKDDALYKSKQFLFQKILGSSEEINDFTVIPLTADKSDELTTLFYKSDKLNKSGLLLGFYGRRWNDYGTNYNAYGFKYFDSDKATEFLDKISKSLEDYKKYLQDDNDNNNIYFKFEDVEILIYRNGGSFIMRLFWNGFDSTWNEGYYVRSKRRFEKKL